jgi:hypothetical protein
MKRYRISTFNTDTSRNIIGDRFPAHTAIVLVKKEIESYLKSQYGELDFDQKFERYMALEKPALSIVAEHSNLLDDICNAYVMGNLYPALTGACCLGERIFNDIIFKVMNDFKSSPHYKVIYKKGSIIDWDKAIEILCDWKIIDSEVRKKYLRLANLRRESVHYQTKDQDLSLMSLEAINLVNSIILHLFGIDQHRKDILIYFEVPGELFIKKEAEENPLVKAFYIPCSVLVGPQHEISYDASSGRFIISDNHPYEEKDISDVEFVKLRNERGHK